MLKKMLRQAVPAPLRDGFKLAKRKLGSVRESFYARVFRRYGRRNSVAFRNSLDAAGYQVARDADYYSPLPSVSRLRANAARWTRPSALRGVEYDLDAMKSTLAGLLDCYLEEFLALPPYEQVQKMGFGPGYTAVDAMTLYMMIRHLKPRRYIEVGSGVSTYYCSLAAQRNASEGHPLEMTCIEPYPFEKLSTIPGIRVHAQKVEDVEIALFQQLQENDVLFIDSSHILRVDGDVQFNGADGLILQDPNDVAGLAERIRWLYEHPDQRESMATAAAVTASAYTWDRNGVEMRAIFASALNRRSGNTTSSAVQESTK